MWLFNGMCFLRLSVGGFLHMQKIKIIISPKPKGSETDIIKHYLPLQVAKTQHNKTEISARETVKQQLAAWLWVDRSKFNTDSSVRAGLAPLFVLLFPTGD